MQEHKPQSVPNLYCRTKRKTHEQEDGARKATKKIKTAQTLRSRNTVTFVTITLPQTSSTRTTHNSTAATSTTREISTQAGTGEKKYARKRKYKNCAAPFFLFSLCTSAAQTTEKSLYKRESKQTIKKGEKRLNYRTPKKKKVYNIARGRSPDATKQPGRRQQRSRDSKSQQKEVRSARGSFCGGVCVLLEPMHYIPLR